MKLITTIINLFKPDEVREVLSNLSVSGLTVTKVEKSSGDFSCMDINYSL